MIGVKLKAIVAFTFGMAAIGPAMAQAKSGGSPLAGFNSGNNKEPYKIDANRLEVQQQANKAIYSGDVVAVQGKMTMRCTTLVVFFNNKNAPAGTATDKPAAQPAAATSPGAGGLKRLECHGPVTITQEKQTATSNNLVFENDVVTMTGNVILSDGDNVQAGEKMVYHTKTGVGRVEGGRVRGIFTPGADPGKATGDAPKAGAKPKT